jgi:photosystem II stability/assembly factor-like uncharacterized protein
VLLAHDPHDPIFNVALSPNFAQDQTVFAATGELSIKMGVYALLKSTDAGVTWSVIQGLPANNLIVTVALSPAYGADRTFFAAGTGGLFVTTNQGGSWSLLTGQPLAAMALSPNFAIDNTLFIVTTQRKIFMSVNRGQTMTPVAAPSGLTAGLNAIAISPNYSSDKTLLLGADADGIFVSTNSGSSWTQASRGLTLPEITQVAFSPLFSTDHTAFASTLGSGVLVSTSNGTLWSLSNSGLSDLMVTSLMPSPNYQSDATLWITAASGGVSQSTNSGLSWSAGVTVPRAPSNLTNIHYQTLAAARSGSGIRLYLGMYEGLWTAAAASLSWQYIDTLPTRLIRYVNISPGYADDHTVFTSTYGGGTLWSNNSGATWSFQNTGMQEGYTDASGFSPNYASDRTAFCGDLDGLQITTNGGALWQLSQILGPSTYPRALAVSPDYAQDSTLMVGSTASSHGGLFLSTDGGNTWTQSNIRKTGVISIAISPAFASDHTAFAAGYTNGLYKSTDGGQTWTLLTIPGISGGLPKVVLSPSFAADGTVFAVGFGGGIYKSTNGGATWSPVPGTAAIRALDLEVSPDYADDQTFFAGTLGQGLIEFTGGGAAMSPVSSFPDTFVLAVGVSPNFGNDHTLFAAGYHGLYKSTDSGDSWTYTMEPARIEESRTTTGIPVQQPPSITYQGSWSSVTAASSASTDTYRVTTQSGSTAVLNFVGSGVRWITSTGPAQGSVSIQLDGSSQGTVSLNAPSNLYQQPAWEQHGLSCAPHTLTITASPQPGQSVVVDAFDIWLGACSLANTTQTGSH